MSLSVFEQAIQLKTPLPANHLLRSTTYINQFKDAKLREILKLGYGHKDLSFQLFAVVFNSIMTEHKSTFWISRSSLEALMNQDKHFKRKKKTLSGAEYKNFFDFWTELGALQLRRKGGRVGEVVRCSVYRLTDSGLLEIFDRAVAAKWREMLDGHACQSWDKLYEEVAPQAEVEADTECEDSDEGMSDYEVEYYAAMLP